MNSKTERLGISITQKAFLSIDFLFREQTVSDYGIDAHAELMNTKNPTGKLLGLQVKSGASYFSGKCDNGYIFRIDKEHIEYWLNHALPVLICLCDTKTEEVYWEIVNKKTVLKTGKRYKIIVPKTQTISSSSFEVLCNFLTPIIAMDNYTIFKIEDVSHADAKRYSIDVVLNNTMNKAEVASIIRQVTSEAKQYKYHKSYIASKNLEDMTTHVVYIFIYSSAEDCLRRNHIAKSIWINESLDPNYRPEKFSGENIGEGIIVNWNINHETLSKLFSKERVSKETFLSEIYPRIEELKAILDSVNEKLNYLNDKSISENDFLSSTKSDRIRINELYLEITEQPPPPFECIEVNTKLQSFIALLHDIYIVYSEKGLETWNQKNRLQLSLKQILYAHEKMQHLEYEISKIR